MNTLYNIIIHTYTLAIKVFSLFNLKAKLWVEGRKNIFHNLKKKLKNEKNTVWFHCASLGEFEQAKPIINTYKSKYPNHKILLTFFSPSGFEVQRSNPIVDWVFYLPSDTKFNAKTFINITRPIKAIFIKYEFWFNYIDELYNKNIPLYIVSAIFRKNQVFFKLKWFENKLRKITHIFVQDKQSHDLLNSIHINNQSISGDSRFDSVIANAEEKKNIKLVKEFSQNQITIVCGSTWPKDEVILNRLIKNYQSYNYIIAPHELNNVKKLQKQTSGILFSKADENNINASNVLIIDQVGILSHVYRYGKYAYVGGGFGRGIHNILEAIIYGVPVIFGPKYGKFKEARDLVYKKAAKSINNYQELVAALSYFEKFDKSITEKYINENSGATNKIVETL